MAARPAYDLVIVGGGIARGALATVMARAGKRCLVLEKSAVYPDKVRGEWIAPWGVVEARRLGVLDVLEGAGGHYLRRHIPFSEEIPPEVAIANAFDMTALLPGVQGPLALRHPTACRALIEAAANAGATVLRGVSSVRLEGPGEVSYVRRGDEQTARARLVVGADGRGSAIRRMARIDERSDPAHHLFTGLLVEGADDWPDDVQTKGTEGEVNFLAFPQRNGRVRLYLGYALERKRWLAGAGAGQRLLDAFQLQCVPWRDAFARARPASPCHSYPNNDTWTDQPCAAGVVLVGDAAGHNDPIIGQGLSITLRDVRMVADLLRSTDRWDGSLFAPYADERRERMRRLRFVAWVASVLDSEFHPGAKERRIRAALARQSDPLLGLATAAAMVGPEIPPPAVFTPAVWAAIVGSDVPCPESVVAA